MVDEGSKMVNGACVSLGSGTTVAVFEDVILKVLDSVNSFARANGAA